MAGITGASARRSGRKAHSTPLFQECNYILQTGVKPPCVLIGVLTGNDAVFRQPLDPALADAADTVELVFGYDFGILLP